MLYIVSMNTSSSDADDTPSDTARDGDDGGSSWLARLLLILSFGVALGIEGMTLLRSYVLDGEGGAEKQVESRESGAGRGEERAAEPLRTGDDLLPTTAVSERVAQMRIRARSDGPWVFRLVVSVVNDGGHDYRLTVRDLEADDDTVFEEVYSVECPPDDSTRLVATWPVGADARPHSLTAEAELRISEDSTRTVRRRVSFGHVPVQMER